MKAGHLGKWGRLAMGGMALYAALGASAGAMGAEMMRADLRERVIELRAEDGSALETTVFSPPGDGPFPLVVMNHGKNGGDTRAEPRARYLALSREFVQRGYAVATPMRRGFASSGGEYVSAGCDMEKNALRQASDIRSALDGLTQMSWVKKDEIIVAGQSYGGLAALALGAEGYPGLRATINFAGGLKDGSCDWGAGVERAMARFGSASKTPSLWFYGANDLLFSPEWAQRWIKAYNARSEREGAAPSATLVAFGAFKKNAHELAGSWRGPDIWAAPTDQLLESVGLPTQKLSALPEAYGEDLARGQKAQAELLASLPSDSARAAYRSFLSKPYPRAFAVASNGAWSWSEDGDDPVSQALTACERSARGACEIYAVDGAAVNDGALMAPAKESRDIEPSETLAAGSSAIEIQAAGASGGAPK